MKIIQRIGLAVVGLIATMTMQAQETYQELEQLTVNEEVTTVITASEPIRFVDISTDKVAGDAHQQHHQAETKGRRSCRR